MRRFGIREQMSLLTQSLSHILVKVDGVGVFHKLSNHLTLVVLHHQHLLRFGHAAHHQQPHLQETKKRVKIITSGNFTYQSWRPVRVCECYLRKHWQVKVPARWYI